MILREHATLFHRALISVETAIGAGLYLLVVGAHVPTGETAALVPLLACGLLSALAWPATASQLGLYDSQRRTTVGTLIRRLGLATLVTTVLILTGSILAGLPVPSRALAETALTIGASLSALRLVTVGVLRIARRRGSNFRNLLLVGTGPRAVYVRNTIERHPEWGLHVIGYVDESDIALDPSISVDQVHKLIDLPLILRERVVDEVVVACPRTMLASLGPVVAACAAAGIPLTMLTDIFGDYLPPPRLSRFGALDALTFAPVHHSRAQLAVKRGLDVLGSGLLLLLSAPLIGASALAIRVSSPGPVLFRQIRVGLYGRHFLMLKLRTMSEDAEERKDELVGLNEEDGPVFKIRRDPRITPVGRWLRRFSIDELPQLWNVLRGDMSLVGPRPPIPGEVAQYKDAERRRLSMRPGLTCLWQVSGRNTVSFDEWVRMDLEYIDTWSLARDARILVRTVPAVLSGSGH